MVSNRTRILKIKEIFFNETDENNELTYVGLIERLEKNMVRILMWGYVLLGMISKSLVYMIPI